MKNTKIVASSLNRKIIENEQKMKNLLSSKDSKTKPIHHKSKDLLPMTKHIKKIHKKNKSLETMNITNSIPNKSKILSLTPNKIEDHSVDSIDYVKKIEKKLQNNSKNTKSMKQKEKIMNNKKKIFNDINIKKQILNQTEIPNSKKVNQKEIDIIVNRLYTNKDTNRKNKENQKDNSNTIDYSNSKKSKVNFSEIYSRFQDDIKKRNENLEKKREEINNKNKYIYTYKPKLHISKKFFDNQDNEDFLERIKKYVEDKKNKEEKYKENLLLKEKEEIDKSKILSKNKSKNIKEIEKAINELVDWEKNRKKKLEEKQKEKESQIEKEFNYKPKINKKSKLLAKNNKIRQKETNVFNRLAKEDKVLKEKHQILIELYTPSFKPNITTKKKLNNNNPPKEKDFDTVSKRWKSDEYFDNSDSDLDDEKNDDDFNDNDENDYEFNNGNNDIFTEENIQNAYRKALFHKNKK